MNKLTEKIIVPSLQTGHILARSEIGSNQRIVNCLFDINERLFWVLDLVSSIIPRVLYIPFKCETLFLNFELFVKLFIKMKMIIITVNDESLSKAMTT